MVSPFLIFFPALITIWNVCLVQWWGSSFSIKIFLKLREKPCCYLIELPLTASPRRKSGFCSVSPRLRSACHHQSAPSPPHSPIWRARVVSDFPVVAPSGQPAQAETKQSWRILVSFALNSILCGSREFASLTHQFKAKLKASEEKVNLEFPPKSFLLWGSVGHSGSWDSDDVFVEFLHIAGHFWGGNWLQF